MKKFLSLVLALVMTMSLVTIGAGAADFTDDSDIDYKEAVDVISALGIVDGYSDGSFRPDGSLTRGAAAKIICNLILGPTTADALSASTAPFRDVPTTNTFAGYITYCAQQGIINGYGDGTFRPSGTLTGNAFMKMLLGALGYSSSIEGYTGANWQVNVVKQAVGIGLDDGNEDFVGSQAVTRGEAALYAFNMLKATMVEYDSTSTVVVGDITINTASSRSDVTNGTSSDGNIEDDGLMQFAEMYFSRLTLTEDTTDDFGRPANTWRYRGSEVGTYAKTADASYTGDVRLGQIYTDLGMSSADDNAVVYVDGVEADDAARVSRGNDLKIGDLDFDGTNDCAVGNGTLVEAYLDDDNNVTIVAINTYVAEVNRVVAATSSRDAYITLSGVGTAPMPTAWTSSDYFETEGFEDDQIVLFTYSNSEKEIESVVAAESVEGTLNRKVATKSLTLGDTAYNYSEMYGVENSESDLSVGSEYVAYTDTYGYVIYVEESEYNIADYALLRELDSSSTVFGSDRAALLTYDGNYLTVDTAEDYYNGGSNADFNAYGPDTYVDVGTTGSKIVVARETSSGDYRLRVVDTQIFDDGDSGNQFSMTSGVARINLTNDSTPELGTDYIYADSRTVFVVGRYSGSAGADDANVTWTSYTGISNAPSIALASAGTRGNLDISYYCRSGSIATIMFIKVDTDEYDVTAGNSDVIFLAMESASGYIEDINNDYYELNAVVGGEIVENIKIAATEYRRLVSAYKVSGYDVFNVAFNNAAYDDDVITSLNDVSGSGTAQGVNKLSNENLVLGYGGASPMTYVVADDVEVFFVDDDGDITAGTINQVRRSTDDIVTYVIDSSGQISHLFIQQYFENNEQTSGGSVASLATLDVTATAGTQLSITANATGGGTLNNTTLTVTVTAFTSGGATSNLGSYTVTTNASGVATIPVTCASGWSYQVTCGNVVGLG